MPSEPPQQSLEVRCVALEWNGEIFSLHRQSPWLKSSSIEEHHEKNCNQLKMGGAIESRGLSLDQVEFYSTHKPHNLITKIGVDQKIVKGLELLQALLLANTCANALEQGHTTTRQGPKARL